MPALAAIKPQKVPLSSSKLWPIRHSNEPAPQADLRRKNFLCENIHSILQDTIHGS